MSKVAGSRRAERGLVVDYADVLAQAVANERFRVLREVRSLVASVPASEQDKYDRWTYRDRRGEDVRQDVVDAIDKLLREA